LRNSFRDGLLPRFLSTAAARCAGVPWAAGELAGVATRRGARLPGPLVAALPLANATSCRKRPLGRSLTTKPIIPAAPGRAPRCAIAGEDRPAGRRLAARLRLVACRG